MLGEKAIHKVPTMALETRSPTPLTAASTPKPVLRASNLFRNRREVMPVGQVDWLDAENSASLDRQRNAIGGKVPLPPANAAGEILPMLARPDDMSGDVDTELLADDFGRLDPTLAADPGQHREAATRRRLTSPAPGLALANDCDLPDDDRRERERMRRDKRDKDVAGAQLALDFRIQFRARRERLNPEFERADLLGRPQMPGHEGKPLDLRAAEVPA